MTASHSSLRVLLVEDEALLLMQLEMLLEDAGHLIVGTAVSSAEAMALANTACADLALVDIHLADGLTGSRVGRYISQTTETLVVYTTANPTLLKDDCEGGAGVIAKPHSQRGLAAALRYLVCGIKSPPPDCKCPDSIVLASAYVRRWSRETPVL